MKKTYKKIYYKVVDKNRRSIYARGKYSFVYKKGAIVVAPPWSLGIFCFVDRIDACNFMGVLPDNPCIKRVEARQADKVETPDIICIGITEELLDRFYKKGPKYEEYKPPNGTVCFRKIKVLD